MIHITSLTLTNFRNYESANIDGLDKGFITLIGENGAGKTNCLEAISILSPGRGLRGASTFDCRSNTSAHAPWAVSAEITDNDGDSAPLGVGQDPQKPDKKIIRYNGAPIKSQQELGEICRTVWLTPQMDGLFLQGASERRRFFDRLVATFDPSHTGRLTRYEKATRERISILKTAHDKKVTPDTYWLSGLENIMAETGIAIAAARLDLLDQLQRFITQADIDLFPHAHMQLNGEIEKSLSNKTALSVEEKIKETLHNNRQGDAIIGRTLYGTHRTDLSVIYDEKNQNAAQCSTGEQKALLTAIILAHTRLVRARFGMPPILLFDEICAHFDEPRRDSLFDILGNIGGQIWMTGQDGNAFQSIKHFTALKIKDNKISTFA